MSVHITFSGKIICGIYSFLVNMNFPRDKKKKKIEGKRKKTWKKLENENLNVFLYK